VSEPAAGPAADEPAASSPAASAPAASSWTARVREWGVSAMPPERLLPDSQPAYMSSWIYIFGVLTIAALIVIIGSGVVLGLKGPAWWHYTGVGHFFNSIHLWAVELFFFCMVIHLWGKFFMAAWRGGRSRTWMSGAITFLISIVAAFTGYVSQQNFDSQWIATQAKDGINATGAGAFFNVLNFGQMYSYHLLLLPVVVVGLVIAHILLVRRNGIVPPLPLGELVKARPGADGAAAAGAAGEAR
jgi:quinol-cytochrome oxidoreductase complex cytochrome b subunit